MLASLPRSRLKDLGIVMDMLIPRREARRPIGGRIALFVTNWHRISQDPWVRETVTGHRLELATTPIQGKIPEGVHMDPEKVCRLSKEVEDLAGKGAITPCGDNRDGFFSQLFLVPKSDGSWRPVINLKRFNQFVLSQHFKMESVRTVKAIIQKGDWLVKLDLKDAYLSVPIHKDHQKYLRFRWENRAWQFRALPFGLSSAPQTFTKLLKPVVSTLRRLGIRLILYLDDMLIMAQCRDEMRTHLATAMELLCALGFIINMKKSVFTPARTIEFLGFTVDSSIMTIRLPQQKLVVLRKLANQLLQQEKVTARQLAQLLGMMVAAHPAVLPAPLHYRALERAKRRAVRDQAGYESEVRLDNGMLQDLEWWINSAASFNGRPLQIPNWDLTIESDASLKGWGASSQGRSTGGPWTAEESKQHINYLELLAAFLALRSFVGNKEGLSILLLLDNVTAIAFINRMGGTHSVRLSDLAVEIWNWCIHKNITIHAEHLPGLENVRADWESRHITDSSDWRLHRDVFQQLESREGPFSIDLFASRTNTQLPLYCSWRPDPDALAVDAFSITWRGQKPYLFPPFALIPRCLNRLREEGVTAWLIAPVWPNQIWFPQLLAYLIDHPTLLPPTPDIVSSPEGRNHPLAEKGHLPLAAWCVSGDPALHKDFQSELRRSSGSPGELQLSWHTTMAIDNGLVGALKGKQIHFQLL